MKRSLLTIMGITIAALILTACGGISKPSTTIHVAMTDFVFQPNAFTVPAGPQISLVANTGGVVTNSLLFMKLGRDIAGVFTAADRTNVYREQAQIAPGQTLNMTLTAPTEPGSYQIVCGIGGHMAAGMVAKLAVVSQP